MKFDDFIKNGQVKKCSEDAELMKSLVSGAETDLKFLRDIEISETSARKIMANYYDILRAVLEAIAVLDGYKIYSHEAFAFFLKEKGENIIAEKFDRFRKIRNGINYYGKTISVEEVKENSASILKVIETLKKKYLEGI